MSVLTLFLNNISWIFLTLDGTAAGRSPGGGTGGIGGGLWKVWEILTQTWIAPIFLIGVAIVAVIFIKNRQFRELGAFILIAAFVAVLVLLGNKLFIGAGGTAGKLTRAVDKYVLQEIN